MSLSDVTASPAFEDVWRTAVLEVLARDEFLPGSTGDESGAEFPRNLPGFPQFAALCVGVDIDSSTDDPASRLIDRIMAATRHDEIIAVLPLLGCRAIADRLDYLREISGDDDPDEPPMTLDSLRELALFLVSEPQWTDPEIGISPDGVLQAEWRCRDGILAMKFLPAGFIRFAAVSRTTGIQPQLRVQGTLPKDKALRAMQAFTHQGAP